MARGDGFFHYPTQVIYDWPEEYGLRYESVFFNSCDGLQLHGWFFPAASPAQGTLVHCHGNAGNVTGHYRFVAWLPRRGWNALCFDYRGYGRSEGTPTVEGAILDATAARAKLCELAAIKDSEMLLMGESLGGAIIIQLAAKSPPGGTQP